MCTTRRLQATLHSAPEPQRSATDKMISKPTRLELTVSGLIATIITLLVVGFAWMTIQIFVLGNFTDKFGPWGTFKIGATVLLVFSIALGIGFLLGAYPSLLLAWINSKRTMAFVSLLSLSLSLILLVTGFTKWVSRLSSYPGAVRVVIAMIPIHAVIILALAWVSRRMRIKAEQSGAGYPPQGVGSPDP